MESNNIDKVESITVYTLLDDYAGYETSFYGQHGIAFLLEVIAGDERKRVLFDTGQSGQPILDNMEKLRVNPKDIDLVFLSHCHYDHTGGLIAMLKAIDKPVPVIAHPKIFRRNLVKDQNWRHVGLGATKEEISKFGAEWILDNHPRKLVEGVTTTGEIIQEDKVEFEKELTSHLYTMENGKMVNDTMVDDMSLVIETRGGLVVVSGCSHAGIVSIVRKAIQVAGNKRVKAVVGGYHLIDAKKERLEQTVTILKKLGVEKMYAGHCTGLKAECAFINEFGENFEKLHSGKVVEF